MTEDRLDEFIEPTDDNVGRERIDFNSALLWQVDACRRALSQEMTGGYFKRVPKLIGSHTEDIVTWVPDARMIAKESVNTLHNMLCTEFDDEYVREHEKVKKVFDDLFVRLKENYSKVSDDLVELSEMLNITYFPDEIHEQWRNKYMDFVRAKFQLLLQLMKRNGRLGIDRVQDVA